MHKLKLKLIGSRTLYDDQLTHKYKNADVEYNTTSIKHISISNGIC